MTSGPSSPATSSDEVLLLDLSPTPGGMIAAHLGPILLGILLCFIMIGIPLLLFLGAKIWIDIIYSRYRLTDQRLLVRHGWLSRTLQELELYRAQDVMMRQNLVQRALGVGDVIAISIDKTTPLLVLRGIADPETVKETIRSAYRNARKREGVRTTENIIGS